MTLYYTLPALIFHKFYTLYNLISIWFKYGSLQISFFFCTQPDPLLSNWSISLLDGTTIEKMEEFKYLGLWLDSQLSFKPHINSITKKNFGYCSVDCFSRSK